jgi:hypothetical protein
LHKKKAKNKRNSKKIKIKREREREIRMMKTIIHRRIVVVIAVLVVTISCSNVIDAIRLTGDRGLVSTTRNNNHALLLLKIRGGDDISSPIEVIPDAILPNGISGMSVPAFQFQQQQNNNDNDNNERVNSYSNSDFDLRGHVKDATNIKKNYVSLTHPIPSSFVASPPDNTTTTTTTTLQLHHVLRRRQQQPQCLRHQI